jgi:hypothetical protein
MRGLFYSDVAMIGAQARIRSLLLFAALLSVSGCGVVLPYAYDAAKLDELTVSMPKKQVLKKLGKPDRVVSDDGQLTLWEYRLYAKHEWFGYLIHCPWHPFCYIPGEGTLPYWVALHEDEVCLWGDPEMVRPMTSKLCPHVSAEERRMDGSRHSGVSVIPVFMPPAIAAPIRRLAIVPIGTVEDTRLLSWLDLTLNFLRSRHPEMVLVEREALRPILEEIGIQYTGRVDDDTMARVGHFVGADTLLTYRLSTSPDTEMAVASFELRLLNVEHGTALFRQHTAAVVKHDRAGEPLASESTAFAARSAAAHGLAALMAAFGDDPLGVVPDYAWSGEGVRLLGVLEGSPASLAGLRTGDRVLSVGETPLRSWTDLMAATASLKVKRKMQVIQVRMPLRSLLNTSPE